MRLTSKLSFAIGLGIVVVLIVNGWVRLRGDSDAYRADVRRDHDLIARGIAAAVQRTWQEAGASLARALVDDLNAREALMTVRFVGVDAGGAEPRAPYLIPSTPGVRSTVVDDESGAAGMLTYARLDLPDVPGVAAVELYEPMQNEQEFRERLVVRTVITTTILVAVCVLLTLGFGIVFVARPMRTLVKKAERIGAGDLEGRLAMAQNDEIRDLGRAMNDMCDRLEAARERIERESVARLEALDQLRHADRLRTVGELASGIAHELGTPLAVARARGAAIANGEVDEPRMRHHGGVIVEHADRMAAVIRRLLDFARRRPAERRDGELGRVVDQAVRFVAPLADKAGVEVSLKSSSSRLSLSLDEGQMQQALANLLVNAIHATKSGGHVEVTVRGAPLGAEVVVDDDGPGVDPANTAQVFDPFFTTKPAGEGTGLGLTIALGIVREHGGTIELTRAPLGGARFTVSLPTDPHGSAPRMIVPERTNDASA